MTSDMAVLVVSCDSYADIWPAFFNVFWARWPDCPYPVYLGSNYKHYNNPRVTTIAIEEDRSWTNSVRSMLVRIDAKYVILLLEDFLFTAEIDTSQVEEWMRVAKKNRVGCLRLVCGVPLAFPPSRSIYGISGVGEIEKGETYRVSAQVAIWCVETLNKVLIPGLSAWEFEEIGTLLSYQIDDTFWGVENTVIPYQQCVEKGKWKPEGLRICAEHGVEPDTAKRGCFSETQFTSYITELKENNLGAEAQGHALARLYQGRRRASFQFAFQYLRFHPFDIRFIIIMVLGLLNSTSIRKLRNIQLRYRLRGKKA